MSSQLKYQEIDFLIPSQEFTVNFSYVSGKGLSFIREYILRIVNIAPMSKMQIAVYFGLSDAEATEAIDDLISQDFLELKADGRLGLTLKGGDLFSDSATGLQMKTVEESSAKVTFELTSFCFFKNEGNPSNQNLWMCGLRIDVPKKHEAYANEYVLEKFKDDFFTLAEQNYLPNSVTGNNSIPRLYMVNAVIPTFKKPLRLSIDFNMDHSGEAALLDKFDNVSDSNQMHSLIAEHIGNLRYASNANEIVRAMSLLGDEYTPRFLNAECKIKSVVDIEDALNGEIIDGVDYNILVGSISKKENWETIEREISSKKDEVKKLRWLAPSDPYWGKSLKIATAFEYILSQRQVNQEISARVYLPVESQRDKYGAKTWLNTFKPYDKLLHGVREGFCDGNVEILHIEGVLVAVVYHIHQGDGLPVTLPIGFYTKDLNTVNRIGRVLAQYINGVAAHDQPNDCGHLNIISNF